MTKQEIKNKPLYFARADSEFEELRKDKKYAEIMKRMNFRDEHEHPLHLCEDFVDMEERLSKLEEAVAFKGFDEVPEKSCRIQLLATGAPPDWKLRDARFEKENNTIAFDTIDTRWHLPWSELHKHCEGWRYPVGDLSE